MGFLENNNVAWTLFLGQTHFGKLFVGLCFLKKLCAVTLLYMNIYEKCIMFNIAYGKMHEYLAWKRKVSLNLFDSGFHGFMVLFGNTIDVLC